MFLHYVIRSPPDELVPPAAAAEKSLSSAPVLFKINWSRNNFMRHIFFYLLVALVAFGIGLIVVFFSFLKNENVTFEIPIEKDVSTQTFNPQEKSIDNIENSTKEFTCSDKTLLLVWDELKKGFDEEWAEDLLSFGVDDCAKAYEVQKIIDLNKDGKSEIIVHGNNLVDCTVTGNCSFAVFKKMNKSFKPILQANMIRDFKIKSNRTGMYNDLELKTWNAGFEYYVQLFRYNGQEYKPENCWFETHQIKGEFLKQPKITSVKCSKYDYVD